MEKTEYDDPFFKTLILSPFRYSNKTRHIRIADILVDASESETDGYDCAAAAELHHMDGVIARPRNEQDGDMTLQCLSPRRIISRWLSALKRSKRRRCGGARRRRERETEEVELKAGIGGDESSSMMPTTRSTNCLNNKSDQAEFVKDSSSFNLGVACGLIYLIIESRNEFAKMVELRKEMELLVQNAKERLKCKSANFDMKRLKLNEMTNLASSTTDLQQASSSSSESRFSLQSGVVRDALSQCVRNEGGDESVAEMGLLEAELEAELQRLEIHLDSEKNSSSSRYSQKQRFEADGDADCLGDINVSSSGEVIESDEGEAEDHTETSPCDYGVPPLELERRLHELLQSRQEERIKELEDALEYAKHRLHEKEIEASWWKETATAELVSRLVPEPSSPVAPHRDLSLG